MSGGQRNTMTSKQKICKNSLLMHGGTSILKDTETSIKAVVRR